jgi:hypothetical protein
MWARRRDQIESFFKKFKGATIAGIEGYTPDEPWRKHAVDAMRKLSAERAAGIQALLDMAGPPKAVKIVTSHGDINFLGEEMPEGVNPVNRKIKKLIVDRNWNNNTLGTYIAVEFHLDDGQAFELDEWDGFDSEEFVVLGHKLHPEARARGEQLKSKQNFDQELSQILTGAHAAAHQDHKSIII